MRAPVLQAKKRARPPVSREWVGYAAAVVGVAGITGLIHLLPEAGEIGNISTLYLLVVIGTALRFGSRPAVAAAVLAFLAFDMFLVTPRYRITAGGADEWLALGMFLLTALVTGQLTALLQARAQEAGQRAREAAALAEASWAVASRVNRDAALDEVLRQIATVIELEAAAIVVQEEDGTPRVLAWYGERREDLPDFADHTVHAAIDFLMDQGQPIAWEGDRYYWGKTLANVDQADGSYLPLMMEQRALGVLYLRPHAGTAATITPEQRRAVASLANHAAAVLERDRLSQTETRARAMAEADRLKTALLSMVTHNFRSPLASIKASITGLLQVGGAPWDAATQRELFRGIDQETDRLNRMVGNILALSRLEANAWRPECDITGVAELLEATLDSFAAPDRRRIQVEMAAEPEEVWLDPVQIVEVLHNLLDNALKYSPPESPVELRASGCDGSLVLEVLDRGPGLPEGDAERIFERFYRRPGLQESASPGLGLGLAVSHGLVEAHGGRLTARDRDGGGAVFHVELPLQGEE